VVIFGCPAHRDGRIGPALRRRLETGLEVARTHEHATVIVSGGAVAGPAEAPVMRAWLVAQGLDPERVIVEDRARLTIENALFVAPTLRHLAVERVTVVTSRSHLRRATILMRLALRRAGLSGIRVEPRPAADGPGSRSRASAALETIKIGWNLILFPFWRTGARERRCTATKPGAS
jgi:uncharacterized SAM-binding protein YcdF (DUF218 family)